jgi:hypothetical protein
MEDFNYFNYFTEIEDHFQQARGTSLFLLSPLDWALIESWKNAGVPLEAVLRGIDIAFEKWRAKRTRTQLVNSLAFCTQPVMAEAQRMADGAQGRDAAADRKTDSPPFADNELRAYLERNAAEIIATNVVDYAGVAEALGQIITDLPALQVDLEGLEQRLSMLEQKLIAIARSRQSDDIALRAKRDLDAYLKPYRGKMTAPQIAMLEAQFLDRATLETAGLPRLSLFYLR